MTYKPEKCLFLSHSFVEHVASNIEFLSGKTININSHHEYWFNFLPVK